MDNVDHAEVQAMAETAVVAAPRIRPREPEVREPEPATEVLDFFPPRGQWTEEHYFDLPESNWFVELSEGRLVMPDMPGTRHQRVVGKLYRALCEFVETRRLGEVGLAPLPVRLWPGKVREPDLMFMHRDHADRIGERRWGVPDLAVEVISPRTDESSGTEQTDREVKLWEYAQAGVREYWLVHPTDRTIEVYGLEGESYRLLKRATAGEIARSEL
ncbi:MAG: Uma2 family endonuclease, partial [Candidatus Binatia bacterium]